VTTSPTRQSIAALLAEARARTIALIAPVGDELLNRVYSPLLSPLAWDLGHIANFEELWLVQRVGGRAPLHGDLGRFYDAIENPRKERGELPILRDEELRSYLDEVRARTLDVLDGVDVSADSPDRLLREGFVYEMLVAHELQHQETMLQLLQMLDVPYRPAEADPEPFAPAPTADEGGTIRVEAGT
jgi:iron(II)-dependent oxidoreductase